MSFVRYLATKDPHPPAGAKEHFDWLASDQWRLWEVYDGDHEDYAYAILDNRFSTDGDGDRPEGNYPHYLYIHSECGLSRHEIVVRYSVHMSPGDEAWFGKNE